MAEEFQVQLEAAEKQRQVVVMARLKPGTTGLRVRRPYHTATRPHIPSLN